MAHETRKTIEIDWEGRMQPVVIRRWSFGEKLSITKEATTLTAVGNAVQRSVDSKAFTFGVMKACIVSAPFPVTDKGLYDLPEEIGDYINAEIEAICTKKKETTQPTPASGTPSSTEPQTPTSNEPSSTTSAPATSGGLPQS